MSAESSSVSLAAGLEKTMLKTHISYEELMKAAMLSMIFLCAFFAVDAAYAQSIPGIGGTSNNGLGGFVTRFKQDTLIPLLEFGVYVAYAAGVGVTGVGVNKFIKVSKGDPQTGPGEAAAYTFGGGALMALGFIADYAANSMNVSGAATGSWGARSAADILQALLPVVA